jgi:hypothetical protein
VESSERTASAKLVRHLRSTPLVTPTPSIVLTILTVHPNPTPEMLPSYSKLYEHEPVDRDADASNPLLGSSNPEITNTLPPIYPPSSSSTLPPISAVRHTVEYTYKPVFPRKGSTQYVVGPLGRTKQVSNAIRRHKYGIYLFHLNITRLHPRMKPLTI